MPKCRILEARCLSAHHIVTGFQLWANHKCTWASSTHPSLLFHEVSKPKLCTTVTNSSGDVIFHARWIYLLLGLVHHPELRKQHQVSESVSVSFLGWKTMRCDRQRFSEQRSSKVNYLQTVNMNQHFITYKPPVAFIKQTNKQTSQLFVLRKVLTKMVKISDLVHTFPVYGPNNPATYTLS
jgi:hypothetical protein